MLLVKPAYRLEISHLEPASRVLHTPPQDVQRPACPDLVYQPSCEAFFHFSAVLCFEFLPHPGLGGVDEVEEHLRVETECTIVVIRAPFDVVRLSGGVKGLGFTDSPVCCVSGCAGQGFFDGLLEVSFGCVDHGISPRTSILPVTAAEIRAVRYSFNLSICSYIFFVSASIFAVSRSRKFEDKGRG